MYITITGVTRAGLYQRSARAGYIGQQCVSAVPAVGSGICHQRYRNVFMNCVQGGVRIETVVPEEPLLPDRQTDRQTERKKDRLTKDKHASGAGLWTALSCSSWICQA